MSARKNRLSKNAVFKHNKSLQTVELTGFFSGGPEEDRTLDLCIANAALSQLSYGPTKPRQSRAF